MATFTLHSEQWLPRRPDEVFDFYSDAFNLELLTPPWLKFQVLTPPPLTLSAGAEIEYRLRLHGIPMRWQSRITEWAPPHHFTDAQIKGPYRQWTHRHLFIPQDGGTLVQDSVEYAMLGGWLADILMVRRDLRRIFAYRQARLAETFGGASPSPAAVDLG